MTRHCRCESLQSGEEAALSAFDTQFTTSLFFDRDELAFNNPFIGGGATSLTSEPRDLSSRIGQVGGHGNRFRGTKSNAANEQQCPDQLVSECL